MELKTRRVHFVGCTMNPNEKWMKQVGRDLTNCEDGFINGKRYVLLDRDTKFCESFRELLTCEGIEPIRLPPRSPNLNAHLERFFGSLKSECVDRMIFFGEGSLRNVVREFLVHYHGERNHQGLGNTIIDSAGSLGRSDCDIHCRKRLGGMLRYYYRDVA